MARGRARGRRGNNIPTVHSPVAATSADNMDDDDEAEEDDEQLMEAIRLSQSEYLSTAERQRRENEEFEKAIRLSLEASTSSGVTMDVAPVASGILPKLSESSTTDEMVTPSSSFNRVNNDTFFSAVGSDLQVGEDVVVESGQSTSKRRNSKSNGLDSINDADLSVVEINGCDSTVKRGQRGRGRRGRGGSRQAGASGRQLVTDSSEINVSSTRGRGGRKGSVAAAKAKPVTTINLDDGSDDDSDEYHSGIRDSISSIFAISDEASNSSEDEWNPDDGGESPVNVCSSTTKDNVPSGATLHPMPNGLMTNADIANRMKSLFEQSLKLHLTGQYMQACEAISTKLYPHQMYALAWMSNRENHRKLGMRGGILADDMGLGKTLSIISLILTNFHDEKPLARPQPGYRRKLSRSALRYMPQSGDSEKFSRSSTAEVGAKAKRGGNLAAKNGKSSSGGGSSLGFFDHLNTRKKDTKQKVKSTRKPKSMFDSSDEDEAAVAAAVNGREAEGLDSSSAVDLDDGDEFDAMLDTKTLGEKLDVTPDSKILTKSSVKFFDDLSDDEEYQNMTEAERNEKMKPKFDSDLNVDGASEVVDGGDISRRQSWRTKLNLDGATSFEDSDSDFEEPCSSSTVVRTKKNKRRILSDDDDDDKVLPEPSKKKTRPISPSLLEESSLNEDLEMAASISLLDDKSFTGDETLPDIDIDGDSDSFATPSTAKNANDSVKKMLELTPSQIKNLKIPPKDIATLKGRRRATLVVTNASLIGQWLGQIELHVHKNVNLDIFVHHGQSKAVIALELQDKDIVMTTYGTLMTEFKEEMHGPLLRAKWLRVVLDEGHQIKNHRAKTFKAAANLDTERRWIVSGTPIQNNLTELWALLNWLGEPNYGNNRPMFKHQIENAIKKGHPRGIERLQVLIETICLRRTKSDEIDGRPLVNLPTKLVTLKELEFNKEEKIIYDAYHNKGKELILKYMKRGTLLRNYAHVFAVMMRLRQLCCHRELLPVKWQEVDMNELTALATKELEPTGEPSDSNGGLDDDVVRRLAEQLRQMIRDGMSDECSICLSEFQLPVITPCAHVYCRPCITQHIDTAPPPALCPLCRGPIKANLLLEAARDEESDDGAKSDSFEDIIVEVSSTKVNAVLKELEICRRRDPSEKSIIVSQFTSFLSIIQPLLTQEGYNWTRLDGSMSVRDRLGVIEDFQNPGKDSPTVLLLSLRAGGVGLNLTAASRLFLLDPAWNPSTEEQCFDRIHRLGQTRNVEIIKFVMKDSIEQRMLRIQEKKKDLISGAFRQTEFERREQRIQDIRDIFDL